MHLNKIIDIYKLISKGSKNIADRNKGFEIRKNAINSLIESKSDLIKNAFDTRRIDQETTYNPRRGLQNYHRSEPFVSENMQKKIVAFSKLANILNDLKDQYGREPAWQDSYARVLCSSVQKALRIKQGDKDYSEVQPSMASLDYLEELMYVRYRLSAEDITNSDESMLRKAILAKDEFLVSEGFNTYSQPIEPMNLRYVNGNNDAMLEKVLGSLAQMMAQMKQPDDLTSKLFDIKANSENKSVSRVVTIKIDDNINSPEPILTENKEVKKSDEE